MKPLFASLMTALLLGSGISVYGQSYDDDDIYYNPSKSKNTVKQTSKKSGSAVVYEYPGADTYIPIGQGNVYIDIDSYNRRGIFAKADTTTQKTQESDFNNTRKIERFYNSDVIAEYNDDELTALYYSQPANINIVVQNDPFAYNYWGYPYMGSSWYWGYSPASWYYNWGWGPSWAWGPSWNWNWGWNWGWGPSWAWGPSWNWGWGPSWAAGAPARPNRPIGNVRPGYGSYHASGNARPGYSGGIRPATSGNQNAYRPGTSSSGYRNSNTIRNTGTTRYNTENTRNDYNNRNNSYNTNPSTRPSTGSFNTGGGGRGGAGSFGGGSRNGGAGGRGRH